jgi:hypothetical protein
MNVLFLTNFIVSYMYELPCILFVNNLYVHPLISLHASDFGTLSKTDPKSLFSTLSCTVYCISPPIYDMSFIKDQ